ncbi:MAG: NUDIX domain-containing protein [Saprospiraceae bacterium]|nr:NUDIX domain-containing protein [Saprospiraceae bacterium]MBK8110147.1 NUDIX domain-containing protein [Saprospiraceae bacterium]MBL0081110.1 NUDIX domain-containing protein [Saprospiraceae bacterium]
MKAKILFKRKLSHIWSEFAQYIVSYTRSDGRTETQVREIHDTGNGAAILLYNLEKKEVVLIRQFRLAAMLNEGGDGLLYEVCAGLIENGDAHATIIKEVKEETGYSIINPVFLFSAYATPGAKTEKIFFFTAPYDTNSENITKGGLAEEQEDIEVIHLPFEAAWAAVQDGTIKDLKTITLLLHARLHLFPEKE